MSTIPELKLLNARRLLVAGLLYVLGLGLYLSLSESKVSIKVLTAVMQATFLLSVSFLFWLVPRNAALRTYISVAFLVVWSGVATFIDSRFIDALRPLHPLHIAVSFSGYLLEAAVFLGLTCNLERLGTGVKNWLTQNQKVSPTQKY